VRRRFDELGRLSDLFVDGGLTATTSAAPVVQLDC